MAEEFSNNQPVPPVQPSPESQAAPAYQAPPAPQAAPQYAQQNYAPAPTVVSSASSPLTQLSGGMKFGWLVIGLIMGIPGMLLAWLINVDKLPQVKNEAIKFAVIGFVVNIVAAVIMFFIISAIVVAAINQITYALPYSYYY